MPDRMVAVGASFIGPSHPQDQLDCVGAFVRDTDEATVGGEPRGSLPTAHDGARGAHVTAVVAASSASGACRTDVPGGRPVPPETSQLHATGG